MLTRCLLAAAVTALTLAAPAAAATICVPTFHAACPNSGTNVTAASLDAAMATTPNDGVKDTVVIAAGQLTDPDSFVPAGTDDLEIVGAGREQTILTSSAAANIFVVNLALGSRTVTMRDLQIRVPASFPDNQGAAVQASGATFERVVLESRNAGTQSGLVAPSGGTFRDGEIRGAAGGTWTTAIRPSGSNPIPLTVEDSTIRNAANGVAAVASPVPVVVRRAQILGTTAQAVSAQSGATATVEQSVIAPQAGTALAAVTNTTGGASVTADHVTILGTAGNSSPALHAETLNVANGGATSITVKNAIVRGYVATIKRVAPASGTIGDATIALSYTNIAVAGQSTGDGAVTQTAVTSADPLFTSTTDLRLLPGSVSIDAADPASAAATDLAGAARPVDGDGDGVARADQGAYEYQPPAPQPPATTDAPPPPAGPGTPPATGPVAPPRDATAPTIAAVRIHRALTHRRGGAIRFTLSEPARVELRFTRRAGRRTRTVRLRVAGRAGRNTVSIPRRRLSPARWRLTIAATDAAGNRAASAARQVTVRR